MAETAPTMTPRMLKGGPGWYVLVTWPSGRSMHLHGFKSEEEAAAWIETDSGRWVERDARPTD